MVGNALIWRLACWLWVGLPILGIVPQVPVRLAVQWLMILASIVVLGVGLLSQRRDAKTPFGWMLLACVWLACLHWRQPTMALAWVSQVALILGSAAILASHGEARWLRQAVIACAWVQVPVLILQWYQVPLPWAHLPAPWQMAGTVGSIRPASILFGLACLWSPGWTAWVLGIVACLTGSGTVMPVVVLRQWWPYRKKAWGWLAGLGLVAVGARFTPWHLALTERLDTWQTWWWSMSGEGFRVFPWRGAFADDTVFGRAMAWRDSHNVWLDWTGRFGLPGLVVLGVLLVWLWHRSKTDAQRWTLLFALWVSCWQSFEQFPVLVIPLLVWLIELSEGGRVCGSASNAGAT